MATASRGCVSVTTFVLVVLSSLAFMSLCGSLTEGLPLAAFGDLLAAGLYTTVAVGLWKQARWAANLMLLVCFLLAAGFVVSPTILTLEIMHLYITFTPARLILVGTIAAMSGFMILLISIVAWWYWSRRRLFLPMPFVDAWGYRLYLVVALIIAAILIADGWTTYQTRHEILAPQVSELQRLNRMMEQTW